MKPLRSIYLVDPLKPRHIARRAPAAAPVTVGDLHKRAARPSDFLIIPGIADGCGQWKGAK